jgi:hypothetical protein
VELNPAEEGFAGTLFEFVFDGERYCLSRRRWGECVVAATCRNLGEGVVEPLRAAGHPHGEIRALGRWCCRWAR